MVTALGPLRRSGVRAGSVMFAATSLASVLHYVFSLTMGRFLGPGEYSVLSALLGIYVVISIPAAVLNTIVVRRVSEMWALGRVDEVGGMVLGMWRRVGVYGGGAVLLLLASSPWLAGFLKVGGVWPVIAMLVLVLPALALFVARGCLQGVQWFGALSANIVLEAVFRLIWGIALVTLGLGASGGLLALTLSSLTVLVLASWSLRTFLRGQRAHPETNGQISYVVLTMVGHLALAVLTNVDTVLARHFLSPLSAGEYAAVATLGKTVLFFPAAVATVMFPKTAGRHVQKQETASTLTKSALATLALCAIPIGCLTIWGRPLLDFSYGDAFLGGAGLLGAYGTAMGTYALVSLLLQYSLAIDDTRFVFVLAGAAIASLLGVAVFHASATQIVWVVGAVGGVTIAAGIPLAVLPAAKGSAA